MEFFNLLVKCSEYPTNAGNYRSLSPSSCHVRVRYKPSIKESKQVIIRSLYTKVPLFAIIRITISSLNRRLQSYSSEGLQV